MARKTAKHVRRAIEADMQTMTEMFEDDVLDHPLVQRDAHLKIRAERIISHMNEMAQFMARRIAGMEAKK